MGGYIEHIKKHYKQNKNLVYLTCELCIKEPTSSALEKKKKMKNKSDGDEWRRCQHIANFISHIAGHKGMKPGFHCKVKVFNEKLQKYEICGKAATKPQNLATHI